MALRTVPPSDSYAGTGTPTQGRPAQGAAPTRSFAELYRQARKASVNDNTGDDAAERRDAEQARLQENEQNRKYIDGLHERVDTLRGEILVRVIQSNAAPVQEKQRVTQDVSRLSARLDSLREKLKQEEIRLSGKLVDVET